VKGSTVKSFFLEIARIALSVTFAACAVMLALLALYGLAEVADRVFLKGF